MTSAIGSQMTMACGYHGWHNRCKGEINLGAGRTTPCECPHHFGGTPPPPTSVIAQQSDTRHRLNAMGAPVAPAALDMPALQALDWTPTWAQLDTLPELMPYLTSLGALVLAATAIVLTVVNNRRPRA